MECQKNNDWQYTIPGFNIKIRPIKYLKSLFYTMLLCGGLYFVYFITQQNDSLKELLKFQINTLPWSLVTSLFVHNHNAHIQGNALGLLVLLPFFCYRLGNKRGFVLIILFGIGGHLLELIFGILLNFVFYIYLFLFKNQDIEHFSIGLYGLLSPSGAGISGALCGLLVYLFLDLFKYIRRIDYDKDKLQSILMVIIMSPLILLFCERTLADFRFLFMILHSWTGHLSVDLLSMMITYVSGLMGSHSTGNPFLAHFFGGVCGCIGFYYKDFLISTFQTKFSELKRGFLK